MECFVRLNILASISAGKSTCLKEKGIRLILSIKEEIRKYFETKMKSKPYKIYGIQQKQFYVQNSNRLTDVENIFMVFKGEREGGGTN